MKHRSTAIILALLVCLLSSGNAYADSTWVSVSSAEELQKALDGGATNIIIRSSLKGNFSIPRWVSSIEGMRQDITITPEDESKPVFTVESAISRRTSILTSTANSLRIFYLTLICNGEYIVPAIDANSTTKPVTISNVTFKGMDGNTRGAMGYQPSTITTLTGCAFENIYWGVYAIDNGADYDIKIQNCTFNDVAQALAMNDTSAKARASIEKCRGDDVGAWVSQHCNGDSIMQVTVDQATIDSYLGSNYRQTVIEATNNDKAYDSTQFKTFTEDLERTFKALPEEAKKLIVQRQSQGWDNIRVYAMTELGRKSRAIDFSSDDRKMIDECLELYALLASAPVAGVFGNVSNDIGIVESQLLTLCDETIKSMVGDKNLVRPLVYGFAESNELGPLTRTGAGISWGNTGNVRSALGRVSQNPDRIFRQNLHRLQDWLTALEDARKNLQEIKSMAGRQYDYAYVLELDRNLRAVYDFGIAANRFSAAVFFDFPVDVAFAVNFAKVTAESNKSIIMGMCRELGSLRLTEAMRSQQDSDYTQ